MIFIGCVVRLPKRDLMITILKGLGWKIGRKLMSNILITGGSGLLGKNIIPLLEKEHKVIAPFHSEKH